MAKIAAGLFAAGLMLAPRPAGADVIRITSGALTLVGQGSELRLEGSRGLRFDASNFLTPPTTEVKLHCSRSPDPMSCAPGDRISLNAGAADSDLPGLATLDRQTFTTGLGSQTQGNAAVAFMATLVVPSFSSGARVSIFSPFNFFGSLLPPEGGPGPHEIVQLAGSGIVRVDLARIATAAGPAWNYQRAIYAFDSPAAVPEPATLLLVGSGIAGCIVRRRRRALRC